MQRVAWGLRWLVLREHRSCRSGCTLPAQATRLEEPFSRPWSVYEPSDPASLLLPANMDQRFPDATPEDLDRADHVCIICREELTPAGRNKKLSCNHVFHLHCLRCCLGLGFLPNRNSNIVLLWQQAWFTPALPWVRLACCGSEPACCSAVPGAACCRTAASSQRHPLQALLCLCRSWLERQQSCPICRTSVLPPGEVPAPHPAPGGDAAAGAGAGGAGAPPPEDGPAGAEDPLAPHEAAARAAGWHMPGPFGAQGGMEQPGVSMDGVSGWRPSHAWHWGFAVLIV